MLSPDTDIDLSLLQRIVARDETAIAELYDRHSRLAFSVIRRILPRPADAEDVLQDTFVRVWARADTYDARLGSPATWLTRIARNRAIDRLRAQRARADVDASLAVDSETNRTHEPEMRATQGVPIEDAAAAVTIRDAVSHLPEAQRVLIEAAFFEGYTHQELAMRFGVPLGTVKTRIRTGLTALRGRLEQAV